MDLLAGAGAYTLFPTIALLAGTLGGMLGIEVGMIIDPMLIEVGMHPRYEFHFVLRTPCLPPSRTFICVHDQLPCDSCILLLLKLILIFNAPRNKSLMHYGTFAYFWKPAEGILSGPLYVHVIQRGSQ